MGKIKNILLILSVFGLFAFASGPTFMVIVLDKQNRHWLDSVRRIDSAYLVSSNHVWFQYIQARDTNLFFLPFNVWIDTNFAIVKNRILSAGFQDSLNVQVVDTSFFKLPKPIGQ